MRHVFQVAAMKKLSTCVLAMLLAAAMWSQSVSAAQPEQVACYDYAEGGPSFIKTPGKCVFMKNGEFASAFSVYVTDMKSWKHWGAPKATVEGTARANQGFATKVKVRLSKVRNRCGRRVYTKAEFTFPETDSKSDLRLYPC